MDNEIGENSNDDNDMEVAMVLEKAVIETNLSFDHSSSTESPPILAWISGEFQSSGKNVGATLSEITPKPIIESIKTETVAEITTKANLNEIVTKFPSLYTLAGQGNLHKIKEIFFQNPTNSSFHAELKSGLPLLPAARFNWAQVVNFLLENGSPVDAIGDFGTTALHQSCCKGHIKVVEILINYNAELDVQCFDGSTPLHYAVYSGNVDCVKTLLRVGADLTIANKFKLTPVDLAFKMGNELIEDTIQIHLLNLL